MVAAGPGEGPVDEGARAAESRERAELGRCLLERAASRQAATDAREDRRVVEHGSVLCRLIAGRGEDWREADERAVLVASTEPAAHVHAAARIVGADREVLDVGVVAALVRG